MHVQLQGYDQAARSKRWCALATGQTRVKDIEALMMETAASLPVRSSKVCSCPSRLISPIPRGC